MYTSRVPVDSDFAQVRDFVRSRKLEDTVFSIPLVTYTFIVRPLEILSADKATGLGGFSSKLLGISAPVIAPHIYSICNRSLITANFPHV